MDPDPHFLISDFFFGLCRVMASGKENGSSAQESHRDGIPDYREVCVCARACSDSTPAHIHTPTNPHHSPASSMRSPQRLAYGTDQGRWLAEQVGVGAKPAKRRASAARAYHDLADTPAPDAGAQRAAAHRDATQSRSTGDSQMLLAAMIGSMVCIVLTVVFVLPLVLTKHL